MHHFSISDCHIAGYYSMHVLDTKYRKNLRKVVLSKFSSMRKKHEKVQNMYSFWQFSHRDFLTTDQKSLHLCNEITVGFASLLMYKFLLQSACFI